MQSSLVPGTGTEVNQMQGNMGAGASTPGVGAVPSMPSPTNAAQPVNLTATNPYASPNSTSLPTTPAPVVPSNGVTFNTGDHSVVGDFQQTYGQGTGTAITQALSGLGTATDSAVAATTNATNLAADKQYANIRATQAASGVTPDSSSAALAAGDFYSTVNTNLQSTIANMELGEENTLLQTLTGEGQAHGQDTNGWDTFFDVMGDISSVAGDFLIPKG